MAAVVAMELDACNLNRQWASQLGFAGGRLARAAKWVISLRGRVIADHEAERACYAELALRVADMENAIQPVGPRR